jgi:hypothetical protein
MGITAPTAGHADLGLETNGIMRRLLALLLLAGCASTNWRAVAVGATALDTATTIVAINAGAVERNPVLTSSPGRIVAIQAAILAGIWLLSRDLEPEQQAKVWKWVTALHLGAVAWNLTQEIK